MDVRGAGRKGLYSQIRHLIVNYNSDILVLIETRFNSSRARQIINMINKPNAIEIPIEGFYERDLVSLENKHRF